MITESQLDATRNFHQLEEAMQYDLSPKGTLEGIFAAEIIRAAARLHRWANIEDELAQQNEPNTATTQSALYPIHVDLTPVDLTPADRTPVDRTPVDRTRREAHRILKRSMDELRRLQNERRFRIEVLPEGFNLDDLGLTSYKELIPAMVAEKRWQLLKSQVDEIGVFGTDASFEKMLAAHVGPPEALKDARPAVVSKIAQTKQTQSSPVIPPADSTKRTQSAPNTPRNAPCPCRSGQKYKRCCGKNAAPVLYSVAA